MPLRKPPHKPSSAPQLRLAVFLQLDTEHGRGILRGIARYCSGQRNVSVLKFHKEHKLDTAVLRRSPADGIIAKISSAAEERALAALGLPVINISGKHPTAIVPTVNSDDLQIGRIAFRYLHGKGYRHFAYCGSRAHAASKLRWQGFASEAGLLQVTMAARKYLENTEHDQTRLAKTRKALTAWVRSLPRPVAVFAFTDLLALEIARVCEENNLAVPDDVAILGVGNDQTRLAFSHVEISSIQLNTLRIGELAAGMLLASLRHGPRPRNLLVPPLKIVPRQSTDRFAVADESVSAALDYIQENVGNVIYVADIARAAGASRRMLELKFRRLLGTSVYAEVQRQHFAHAVQLMADPDVTIGEIAYASGFPSAQRFSSGFRRQFKESATAYRERLLGTRAAPAG